MGNDAQIENYLAKLEKALKPLPVSDRAEIVTEIKSHILSALERDSAASIPTVLSALGEPETVANRYLAERGQALVKPPVSPMVKWIVIGFLGTVALCLLFVGVAMFKFSPLVSVDGAHDHVVLLGGMIDIDGEKDTVKIGNSEISSGHSRAIMGVKTLENGEKRGISIKTVNGQFSIRTSDKNEIRWECKIDGSKEDPVMQANPDQFVLDMNSLGGVKCEVSIPEKHALSLNVTNGKIVFDKPLFDVDLKVLNGKIDFISDPSAAYKYDIHVANGQVEAFESSDKKDAFQIKMQAVNGKISHSKD
jgi:hypothetical protein